MVVQQGENNLYTYFTKIIIISLAIAPAFALGSDNRNLILIFVMSISPILIFTFRKLYKSDLLLLTFIASITLFPSILHPQSMRWSTVLYSYMFCLTFMSYYRLLLSGKLDINSYLKLLRFLILAYFITLILQQFSVLTGLPIINLSNYSIEEPWKLNSLSSEPSHSARILSLLMYSFISVKEVVIDKRYNFLNAFKEDKWLWLAFIWTMVTMGSATAFVFLPLVLLKFLKNRNIILPLSILLLIGFILFNINYIPVERVINVVEATLTFNPDEIIKADHSASFRIVPSIVLISFLDLTSAESWFGHGVDSVSSFMYQYIPYGGEEISGGGFLQVWYEYGLITFIIITIFSIKNTIRKNDFLTYVFWFMLIFIYGVNNQIVWLCVILLFTNKFFINNKELFN